MHILNAHEYTPVISRFKHIHRIVRQSPKGTFSAFPFIFSQLDETIVQAQIMPYGILPTLPIDPVIRELFHDKIVDLVQCHFLVGFRGNGHGD